MNAENKLAAACLHRRYLAEEDDAGLPCHELFRERLVGRILRLLLSISFVSGAAVAQTSAPSASPESTPANEEETIIPTFETQKLARTYILDVPAPRGQIIDRNGQPLAQNRISYNLSITFPTPLDFSDAQVLSFPR